MNKNDLKREGEIKFEQDLRCANDPRVKLLSASCDRKLLLKKNLIHISQPHGYFSCEKKFRQGFASQFFISIQLLFQSAFSQLK